VHCHNDLGLAVANSLAAARKGARQVECAVNGIGERAGNCSLEEVVMAVRTRSDFLPFHTNVNTREIMNASRLVSSVTGMAVQPNKAIVGENAFAHEAGIHQDGVLKEKNTYEIMRPEDVGHEHSRLVLGKHSGRHAFRRHLEELGIELEEESFERVFQKFKQLSDKKKNVYTEDVEAVVREELADIPKVYTLADFHTTSGLSVTPTATVTVDVEGQGQVTDAATGDGPIDAVYRALDRITGMECELSDYSIHAVTGGKDAMGEVSLEIEHGALKERGRGSSTDVVEASAKAYVSALNRLALRQRRQDEEADSSTPAAGAHTP
jgi:2-isopropylmalate synthase